MLRPPVEVVVIGRFTPAARNALAVLVPSFPAGLPGPHPYRPKHTMPPVFTVCLATRLTSVSAVEVEEGAPGVLVRPGRAWMAPGDFHLALTRDAEGVRLRTHQGLPENPAVPRSMCCSARPPRRLWSRGTRRRAHRHGVRDGLRGCEQILGGRRPGARAGRGDQRGVGDARGRGAGRAGGYGMARAGTGAGDCAARIQGPNSSGLDHPCPGPSATARAAPPLRGRERARRRNGVNRTHSAARV